MYIITFYSFKGGVGRTMALVNVAAQLAKMGRKVLVVDFDLEAPGLETFEQLRPPQPHSGLVEYVTEYVRSKRSPDVRDYIYSAGTIGKKNGQLWVMPAGRRDRDYHLALSRLDWRKLYEEYEGFLFFEDLKAQWEQEYKPDYVLIDSRTGHTDVKGICTRQLPDAVVMLFIPNEQNLIGLRAVCQEIQREREYGLKKDIRLHFVMSNVPNLDDEKGHLHRHLSEFRKALHVPDAPIPIIHRNDTLQMLDQPLFVLQRPHSRLASEYRLLVRSLQIGNLEDREGTLLFLKEVQKNRSRLIDVKSYDKGFRWHASKRRLQGEDASSTELVESLPTPIQDRVNRITEKFWDDAEILFNVGKYLTRFSWYELEMALKRFNRTLELKPDFAEALYERALCYGKLRDDAAAAEDLFRYIRDHGGRDAEKNETVLLELLSISVQDFMKALELPSIAISDGALDDDDWLYYKVPIFLVQLRHWEDAIHWLLNCPVKQAAGFPIRLEHTFHSAIARWGKAGEPDREYCLRAIEDIQKIKGVSELVGEFQLGIRQQYALLFWGAGDSLTASKVIGQALNACKDEDDVFVAFSYWSYQETVPREFQQDCEEMLRMIEGEPIRPAFLASRRASRLAGKVDAMSS